MTTTLIRAGEVLTGAGPGRITDGAVVVADDEIAAVGLRSELASWEPRADEVIDAREHVVVPGLIDAHTHNLEFGGGTAYDAGADAQLMAGASLLFDALRSGVTACGEHLVGHYALHRGIEEYLAFAEHLPQTIRFSVGACVVGTDPVTCLCAVDGPGAVPYDALLDPGNLDAMATASQFPGENLMLTITPANLPAAAAPLSGQMAYAREALGRVVEAYHRAGRRIGAHVEGDEAAFAFLAAGGDVLHHGHGLSERAFDALARNGVPLCATPGGGTAQAPNSPDEIVAAHGAGVELVISTDAVLPVHPEARWCRTADGSSIRSSDLVAVAAPALQQLVRSGVPEHEAFAMLTRNAAALLDIEQTHGTIEPGKRADLVFASGVPGIDSDDASIVRAVMVAGRLAVGSPGD